MDILQTTFKLLTFIVFTMLTIYCHVKKNQAKYINLTILKNNNLGTPRFLVFDDIIRRDNNCFR